MSHEVGKTRAGHICLRGNYEEGNFGDDALLIAVLAILSRHQLTCQLTNKPAFRTHRFSDAIIDSDAHYDLIVYGGGTQFFSFGSPEKQQGISLMRIARFLKLGALVSRLRLQRSQSKKARAIKIGIGLGIGPFVDNSDEEETVANLLRTMKFLWVRDPASEAFCKENEIPHLSSSDLCFTPSFLNTTKFTHPFDNNRTVRVAIVLRDWIGLGENYFEKMVEVAIKLRDANYDVSFFSLSPSDNQYLISLKQLGEKVNAWNPETDSLEGYWAQLASFNLIVTSRYHGAIFALLSGRPFITIDIEPKLVQLKSIFDPGLSLSTEDSSDEAADKITNATARLDQLTTLARQALANQRLIATEGERQFDLFLNEFFQND